MYRVNSKQAASLTRQQLFDMVWAEPMRLLAPRYGISDVGLAKICRRAAIPLPPPGYWARIRHGKRIKRPSLPDKPSGCADNLQISPSGHRNADLEQGLPNDIRDAITAECNGQVRVLTSTRKPNPIVERWLREDAQAPGVGHYRPQRPRISKVERRRLRFLALFFQEIERRGGTIKPESRWKFDMTLAGESLTISVDEALKQVRVPTEHGYYGRDYRIENQGTGALRFQIQHYFGVTLQKRWRDLPDRPLEQQLREILIGLFYAASEIRRERFAREARARAQAQAEAQREAEERRLRAERDKLENLFNQVASWLKARDIRRFVAAAKKMGHQIHNPDFTEWSKWAKSAADALDPLVPESPR